MLWIVLCVLAVLAALATAATVLLRCRKKQTSSVKVSSTFSASQREEITATAASDDRHNYLLTNQGKVYKNPTAFTHVEEIFIRNTPVPALIRIIWLKSSPCASCVAKLINHFRAVKRKPVIYLGRITDMECEEDKKGLVKMTKVGFRFSAWKDMQKLLQGQENTEVVAFIEELLQNYHHR